MKELGTLVVVVLKARNLPDKHTFSKQDPYAVVRLGGTGKQTQVDKRGGQHPVWDEEFHLPVFAVASTENRTLKVSAYAKEHKVDNLIGEGQVDISNTLRSGEFDDWIKLESNGAYRGELYLEMTFFAAGPAPLTRRPSKLAPAERLWRPPQSPASSSPSYTPKPSPPHSQQVSPRHDQSAFPTQCSSPARHPPTSPTGTHLAPPSMSHTPSPKAAPLTLLPEEPAIPATYVEPQLQHVPSVLRPGNVKSSPIPIPDAHPMHPPTLPTRTHGAPVLPPRNHGAPALPPRTYGVPAPVQFPQPARSEPGEGPSGYLDARYRTALPLPLALGNALPDPYAAAEEERVRVSRSSQEVADAELARIIARNEGIDVERLRAEEADAEIARRLEREINGNSEAELHIPGAW